VAIDYHFNLRFQAAWCRSALTDVAPASAGDFEITKDAG
jgi:hypothetical protein